MSHVSFPLICIANHLACSGMVAHHLRKNLLLTLLGRGGPWSRWGNGWDLGKLAVEEPRPEC